MEAAMTEQTEGRRIAEELWQRAKRGGPGWSHGWVAGQIDAAIFEATNPLVAALITFDEAMRNGSIGPGADKMKARALKAAHKKALKALAAHRKDTSV